VEPNTKGLDPALQLRYEKFYPWMIQPRIGLSYQLDAKTVLHAGYGFYSGPQLFLNEEILQQPGIWL